ncbi:MAG: hypothetical protein HY903_05850 [Deltaproteobacteria bacterium]|nr:hypothetical protein [Deltaproteobacteria bacterium]
MGLFANISEKVERSISKKFKAALDTGDGDSALLGLVGKLATRPALARKIYGEGEVFLIKSALFMSGVRLDESAYEAVGTRWKEDLGQRHYDPDAGKPRTRAMPHGILMPHGFYMPLTISAASPLTLRRDHGELCLYLDDFCLFPVAYEPRPSYYDRLTASGVPMRHVGVHRLLRQVLVEYNAYCNFFSQKMPCLFCGIVSDRPLLSARHRGKFAATPGEIAEVVEAAYDEGVATEMQVTGGVLKDQAEVPYLLEVGRAMQARLGEQTIKGSQAVLAAPADLVQVDALKEAGFEGVAFNLEIWNEALWPGIVPGKQHLLPRDGWLRALEHAVGVFGKGNVASVLVAGIEPARSYLEGVEWMAERGIHAVPIPWTPAPGSAFEGHQTPTAAWHLDLTVRVLELWEKHGLSPERHSAGGLHYADLGRMRAHLRREAAESANGEMPKDLRHSLAIEGKLPAL